MRVFVGTSGFSYPEWKGTFYPPGLKADGMLAFYAGHLPSVEINNTFYKMPAPEVMEAWASTVPDAFRFVLKAPQRITHRERLAGGPESLEAFLRRSDPLGSKRAALLFQLPPFQRKDVARLTTFASYLPEGIRAAFEFRHASWFDDEVYDALRARNCALCVAESEDLETPLVATARWGYVRLRELDYDDAALDAWAARIAAQPWDEAFVFLKHELQGPSQAERLARALRARGCDAPTTAP